RMIRAAYGAAFTAACLVPRAVYRLATGGGRDNEHAPGSASRGGRLRRVSIRHAAISFSSTSAPTAPRNRWARPTRSPAESPSYGLRATGAGTASGRPPLV